MPSNPFAYGHPVGDESFTDRDSELFRLHSVMTNGQNMIVIGPRRYGKTSLLNRAVGRVRESGGRSGRVSLITCSSADEVAGELMQGVTNGPLGWVRGHLTEFAQRLKRLRVAPTIQIDAATGGVGSVSLGPTLAALGWRQVLPDVVRLLGDLADEDPSHPVSLVIDEFQKAYEISPLIADIFKDLVDELPRVSLVFSGSKRHLMEAMVNDAESSPLYNVGDKMYLRKIAAEDFVPFLRARAQAAGKEMTEAAAILIYEAALGVPNDVQLIAYWAYETSADTIGEEQVDAALAAAVDNRRQELTAVFENLTLLQQRLLKLLALGPIHAITGRAVQATIDASSQAALDAARVLERAQLAERTGSNWTIASGVMAEWLRSGD